MRESRDDDEIVAHASTFVADGPMKKQVLGCKTDRQSGDISNLIRNNRKRLGATPVRHMKLPHM